MSKLKTLRPKLSFEQDDDEEDHDVFHLKKSKESKRFKKMKQAPGTMDTVDIQLPKSVELGRAYSKESLANLREIQNFSVSVDVISEVIKSEDIVEGTEFSGEAAEEFVSFTQKNNIKTELENYESCGDNENLADIAAIQSARIANKALLKGNGDRLYTKVTAIDQKVMYEEMNDNDSDWENEIIKRGVINTSVLSENNFIKGSEIRNTNIVNDGSNESNNEVSIQDILKSVQLAVDKLEHSSTNIDRRLAQQSVDYNKSLAEEQKLRSIVEIGVKRLNIIQDTRVYFASVVGMVRDKLPLINELLTVSLDTLKDELQRRLLHRVEEQEDIVYRLKESGKLIAVGHYQPTTAIMQIATQPELAVVEVEDEFGRIRGGGRGKLAALSLLKRREERRCNDRIGLANHISNNSSSRNFIIDSQCSINTNSNNSILTNSNNADSHLSLPTSNSSSVATNNLSDNIDTNVNDVTNHHSIINKSEISDKSRSSNIATTSVEVDIQAKESASSDDDDDDDDDNSSDYDSDTMIPKGLGLGFHNNKSLQSSSSSVSNRKDKKRSRITNSSSSNSNLSFAYRFVKATIPSAVPATSNTVDANNSIRKALISNNTHVNNVNISAIPFSSKNISSSARSILTTAVAADRLGCCSTATILSTVDRDLLIADRIDEMSTYHYHYQHRHDNNSDDDDYYKNKESSNDSISYYELLDQYTNIHSANIINNNDNSSNGRGLTSSSSSSWLQTQLYTMTQAIAALKEDVDINVSSISQIIQQLTSFQQHYPAEYKAAYVTMSVVELLKPLILLDLIVPVVATFGSCFDNFSYLSGSSDLTSTAEMSSASISAGGSFLQSRSWFVALQKMRTVLHSSSNNKSEGMANQRESQSSSSSLSSLTAGASVDNGSVKALSKKENCDVSDGIDGDDDDILHKVSVNVLLPWLADCISASLDAYSPAQCKQCRALLIDIISALHKPAVTTTTTLTAVQHVSAAIENVFSSQLQMVFLPMLKLTHASGGSSDDNSNDSITTTAARSFTFKQLHRISVYLRNLLQFKNVPASSNNNSITYLQCFVSSTYCARIAWTVLTKYCVSSMIQLLKFTTSNRNNAKDEAKLSVLSRYQELVLDICVLVLQLMDDSMNKDSGGGGDSSSKGRTSSSVDSTTTVDVLSYKLLKLTIDKLLLLQSEETKQQQYHELLQVMRKLQ